MTGGCGPAALWHALRRAFDLRFVWSAFMRSSALDGPLMFRAWEAFVADAPHWRCACSALLAGQVRSTTFLAACGPDARADAAPAEVIAALRVSRSALEMLEEKMEPEHRVRLADDMLVAWAEIRAAAYAEQQAFRRQEADA